MPPPEVVRPVTRCTGDFEHFQDAMQTCPRRSSRDVLPRVGAIWQVGKKLVPKRVDYAHEGIPYARANALQYAAAMLTIFPAEHPYAYGVPFSPDDGLLTSCHRRVWCAFASG